MASPKGLNLVQGQSRWEGLWGSGSPFPPDLYFSAYLGCRFDKEKFAVFLNLFEPSPLKNFGLDPPLRVRGFGERYASPYPQTATDNRAYPCEATLNQLTKWPHKGLKQV